MENELVAVKESNIHRTGLFAKKDIPAKTRIVEYTGEKITKSESEKRLENADFVYIIWLNNEFDIDGDTPDNLAKYANHSCDPNSKFKTEDDKIWVISKRDIKEGEEITVDYAHRLQDFDNIEDLRCNCGSKDCIGYMVRKSDLEMLKEILKKKEMEKIELPPVIMPVSA